MTGIDRNGVGRSLRVLRELAGLTLAEVATLAGTSPSYLSRVETGEVTASPQYFGRIAAAIAATLKEVA